MFVLILSKRKQDYLMQCGIDPIDGFTDYYKNTKELRQALHTYNIRATGFNKNFF